MNGRTIKFVGLSDYRTVRLSNCRTIEPLDHRTVRLSNSGCQTIELSDYRTVGPR